MKFTVEDTKFPGLKVIHLKPFKDDRGYLIKVFEKEAFKLLGIPCEFKESYYSFSRKHVFRGLHYQECDLQGKLIVSVSGEYIEFAVDLRYGSPTYKETFVYSVNSKSPVAIYIPRGFAHGILAISDDVLYIAYQTTEYNPTCDSGISYKYVEKYIPNDIKDNLILSNKDKTLPLWNEKEIMTFDENDPF